MVKAVGLRSVLAGIRLGLGLLMAVPSVAAAAPEMVCTLIVTADSGATSREAGDCETRITPASTFKIALAVMGYDAGFLLDATQPVLAYQQGDPKWGGAKWMRDTDPTDWMRYSVVWYSQRITRALGAEVLTRYAQGFGYGNADFSGDAGQENGLERAWIASSLLISPREQAAFLRALVTDGLPASPAAMAQAREIVECAKVEGWAVCGKTGTAYPRRADRSFDYARGWGWFVGWAERDRERLVFVRLTQARERSEGSPGNLTREALLVEWPGLMAEIGR
ncbi:MAG: class D beta-lactamase [Cypionkella sp.]|nr:class D beta-lactamase [Cypionkella sp.]MDZ4310014.1 class D beta-lactamase [Cypionkella sp.]